MKIIMESTNEIVEVNGTPARVWEGKTESGIQCFAFIAKIGVHEGQDTKQFETELKEQKLAAIARRWTGANFLFDYDDDDPTPYCAACGAMSRKDCHCGPIAENE